jgi:hypothetical protein
VGKLQHKNTHLVCPCSKCTFTPINVTSVKEEIKAITTKIQNSAYDSLTLSRLSRTLEEDLENCYNDFWKFYAIAHEKATTQFCSIQVGNDNGMSPMDYFILPVDE